MAMCTAFVVQCSRPHSQSSGRGIIAVSKRPSKPDSRAGGDDDEATQREEELYDRYIAPWRPAMNASDSRAKLAALPRPRVSESKALTLQQFCAHH